MRDYSSYGRYRRVQARRDRLDLALTMLAIVLTFALGAVVGATAAAIDIINLCNN
jgi:hypothetical protein